MENIGDRISAFFHIKDAAAAIRNARLALVLPFILCLFSQSSAFAQGIDLSGLWSSDLGPVTIVSTQNGYTGYYEDGRSHIKFQYYPDQDQYQGFWFEEDADQTCQTARVGAGIRADQLTTAWGRLEFEVPQARGPCDHQMGILL